MAKSRSAGSTKSGAANKKTAKKASPAPKKSSVKKAAKKVAKVVARAVQKVVKKASGKAPAKKAKTADTKAPANKKAKSAPAKSAPAKSAPAKSAPAKSAPPRSKDTAKTAPKKAASKPAPAKRPEPAKKPVKAARAAAVAEAPIERAVEPQTSAVDTTAIVPAERTHPTPTAETIAGPSSGAVVAGRPDPLPSERPAPKLESSEFEAVDTEGLDIATVPPPGEPIAAHPDSGLTSKQIDLLYAKLVQERQAKVAGFDRHLQEALGENEVMPDETDMAQRSTEQAYLIRFADKERKLLGEIEHALEKLRTGEYGVCEGTEEPIGFKRLELRPWTRYSVAYKEQMERERNQHRR